jgi:hypothetical protein
MSTRNGDGVEAAFRRAADALSFETAREGNCGETVLHHTA